jgi:hypothetical protein
MKKYYFLELDRYDLTASTRKIIEAPNAKEALIKALEVTSEEVEEALGDDAVQTDDEIKFDSDEGGWWVFLA